MREIKNGNRVKQLKKGRAKVSYSVKQEKSKGSKTRKKERKAEKSREEQEMVIL